jgi:hypothetical protein
MAEPDYGSDLSCTTDLDPLLPLVSGAAMMAQVCLHRLYCRKNWLIGSPNENTIDARDFIGQGINGVKDLQRIKGVCTNVLTSDERIYSADVQASFDQRAQLLTLRISGTGAVGPFNLTLLVSALTVELLNVS